MKRLLWIFLMIPLAGFGQDTEQAAKPGPRVGNPHGDMKLDCMLCHTEQSWDEEGRVKEFDHTVTGFALEGLHKHARCRECHQEPVFAHVGTACADCHQDIHRGRLGPSCADCHTPGGWVDRDQMRRDHDATALPLVGAHERVDCDACHSGPVSSDYVGTPIDCYACHAENYHATTSPDHESSGFGTDCIRCHGVFSATWGSGDFIHSSVFPLTGAHRFLECAACHENGFAGTPTDCVACHQNDYDGSVDPAHLAAGFSTDCRACHRTSAWVPSTFDHNTTAFPLTGEHRTLNCLACHETGYAGTPTDCFACHQDDFDGTTNPSHPASGFPTDCRPCHSTSAWQPSTFDHNLTAFPLTGAHRPLDCLACHDTGYAGTPTDCFACHQVDYDGTTDPNHAASNFLTTCTTCHSTTAWIPSTWDHDPLFPIDSGAHTGISCTECHVVPTDYSAFECILCHEHNRTDSDADHSEVQNYEYLSSECFGCHPRGTN